MDLREKVLNYQLSLTTGHVFKQNFPLLLESRKKTEGRPLGERFAVAGTDRLSAVDFSYTAGEPLIGRVIKWETDPAAEEAARKELERLGRSAASGQSGHCEPFYDDVFSLGLDGLKEKVKDVPSFVIAAEVISAVRRPVRRNKKWQV